MKIVIGVLSLLISGLAMAKTLETDHYRIEINCLNSESDGGCDRVSYDGTDKDTGTTIHLIGRQVMQMCPDQVTSCYSLGYEFSNGNTEYFISEDGQLKIIDGAKVLADEYGDWTYDS